MTIDITDRAAVERLAVAMGCISTAFFRFEDVERAELSETAASLLARAFGLEEKP